MSNATALSNRAVANTPAASSTLEQFVDQALRANQSELIAIVHQALEHPNIYAFGELLDVPSIQSQEDTPAYRLLELFAYGTFADYKTKGRSWNAPELNEAQARKLKALTIIQLAQTNKLLHYDELVTALDLGSVRQLEDLVIELIYKDLLRAKLDQSRQIIEVEYAVGRDVRREQLGDLVRTLDAFRSNYESVLRSLETQMSAANDKKRRAAAAKERLETELSAVHKTLRTVASGSASQSHNELCDATVSVASSSQAGSAARHAKKKKPPTAQPPASP